jgi:broad specificity phosphatase PhoE
MIEAILARHGESEYNPSRRVNGDPSAGVGLTRRGRDEAARLRDAVSAEPIDLCVVTEFPRTHETADIALAGRAIARIVLPELNDPRFGDFEGADIGRFREWLRAHGQLAVPPGGGESRVEVMRRYCRGFRHVLDRHEALVLVVAHGLPVTSVVLAASGEVIPETLEGLPPAHAEARRLSREEMALGIERMERWVAEQVAA